MVPIAGTATANKHVLGLSCSASVAWKTAYEIQVPQTPAAPGHRSSAAHMPAATDQSRMLLVSARENFAPNPPAYHIH